MAFRSQAHMERCRIPSHVFRDYALNETQKSIYSDLLGDRLNTLVMD